MDITTKAGDKGQSQYTGGFFPKSDTKFQFVGTVDELQVSVGGISSPDNKVKEQLEWIQKKLFDIYSKDVSKEDTEKIESWMKEIKENPKITFDWNLTTPKTFNVDNARVVARRLERVYHSLPEEEKNEETTMFLNRLSDYFWYVGRKIESVPKDSIEE
ncbi:MAG: ATP:cob(I)alamin adenosyltransferase [Candidatus Pacearchaeota archaeon]